MRKLTLSLLSFALCSLLHSPANCDDQFVCAKYGQQQTYPTAQELARQYFHFVDAETVAKISQTQSRIDFYDVTEKKIRDSIQFPDEFDNCGFSEDGKWLLVSSETDNWWHLHNRESKKRVASFIAIRS